MAPGIGLGFSVPSGETGDISRIGYWAEASLAHGFFSGRLLAENFRSRGEGFYNATSLCLTGGVSFSPVSIFNFGFSLGPALLFRTHSDASEWGPGFVSEANASLLYTGEKARVGLIGFTRAYPGTSSALLSFGIGVVAGAVPR
ncbi:MAG: hypothetical protein ACPL68_04500 [Candidatus Hydrothermia bacterium]